jgi:hypothetical protein
MLASLWLSATVSTTADFYTSRLELSLLFCIALISMPSSYVCAQHETILSGSCSNLGSELNYGSTSTCTLYSHSLSPTPSFSPHFSLIGRLRCVQSHRKPLPRSTADSSSSSRAYVRKVSRISPFHLLVTSINLVDCYRKSFFNSILPVLFLNPFGV